MEAVALACISACLFGAMTVALRMAIRDGTTPEAGTAYTVVTALGVILVYTVARGEWDLGSAWPFLLAGTLAPGISQTLFTFAIRDAGASRSSVTVGTAPLVAVAIAFVFLGEPVVAGLVMGALLVVAGGALLVSERTRPEHLRAVGLVFAVLATFAFAARDSLIRWLGTSATDVRPGAAVLATMLSGTVVIVVFALLRRHTLSAVGLRGFLPAGLFYGVSYVCLFEAYYRGRVSVVSPLVATESLWGVGFSALFLAGSERVGRRLVAGAVLVVAGGALIAVFR